MPDPRTRTEEIARLRAAIARSGLSNRRYAETVLVRDERTVRRWLAGKVPIPRRVLDFLAERPASPKLATALFIDGVPVAVFGENGEVATPTDGTTWTQRTAEPEAIIPPAGPATR